MRRVGRVALWCLVALLLLRGAADVLASDDGPLERAPAERSSASVVGWPDAAAEAFASRFVRAWLSFSPARRERPAQVLRRFVRPEQVDAVVPKVGPRAPGRVVESVVVAGADRIAEDRALVTVAAEVRIGGVAAVRHVAVPVARDGSGGLVVDDVPSLTAGPAVADVAAVDVGPLEGEDREQLEDVLARFVASYLGGRADELAYLAAPGARLRALAPGLELVAVDSVGEIGPGGEGGSRQVLVAVRARDLRARTVLGMRYRVELVRGDRWYVASVNQEGGK